MDKFAFQEMTERTRTLRRAPNADTADADAADPTPHPLHTLGRQLGNAQIARMLAQRESMPEEEEEQVQAKHDLAQREGMPQEEDEEQVQAKPEVGLEGGPVSDALAGRIESQRGGGSPLDDGTRSTMEGALGSSFEDVRVHSDTDSAQLNHSISAKAFTTGSDIFLGQGASASDHDLMAHELTHVVQQRDMSASGPLTVGPAGDSYEQQADAPAAAVASGASAPSTQRKPDEQR